MIPIKEKTFCRLVSVVIPCYNYGKYLKKAIDSVLAQTYTHIEIIVVDDGSTDNTQAVANTFGSKITYQYKENNGLSAARNTGIALAKGGLIAFLDADDIWLPEKLTRQIQAFSSDGKLGVVSCRAIEIDDEGKCLGIVKRKNYTGEENFSRRLAHKNIVSGGSFAIVRKACFDKIGLFDEALKAAEDWDMWLRIDKHYNIKILNEVLVKIRVGSNSMSSLKNIDKMLNNEIMVINKNVVRDPILGQDKALVSSVLSYRYFTTAWAYMEGERFVRARSYILKAFLTKPSSFLKKSYFGLMVKILYKYTMEKLKSV